MPIDQQDVAKAIEIVKSRARSQDEPPTPTAEEESSDAEVDVQASEPTETAEEGEVSEAVQGEAAETVQDEEEVAEPAPRLTKSWAAIARKEAAMREQRKAMQEAQADITTASEELAELRALKDALRQDPVAAMEKYGRKDWYQHATQRFLKDPSGKAPLEEQLASLRAEVADERGKRDAWFDEQWSARSKVHETERASQGQAAEYVSQVNSLVETGDKFEFIRSTPGAVDAVLEVTNGYLKEYGKLLSPEESATLVEEELTAQAEKLLQTDKLKSRFPAAAVPEVPETPEPTKRQPRKATGGPVNTLSDNLAVSGTPSERTKTRDQEIQDAAALFRRLRRQQNA